jgi:Ca-activated chloride channel homolog
MIDLLRDFADSRLGGFRFDDPLWLLALLVIPWLAWLERRRAARRGVLVGSTALLADLPRSFAERIAPFVPWLQRIGLVLVIGALARPQLGRSEYRIRTEGIAIQLALDRSGSMDALDFHDEKGDPINRLTAVKRAVRQFVEGDGSMLGGRRDDAIGLVVFGGYAEQRCPLTLDHGALRSVLDQVEIPGRDLTQAEARAARELLRDEAATAIGDGLVRAVAGLRDSKQKSRVVILLSDGANTAGAVDPPTAAALAKEQGVKVYTIGMGSTGIAPFRVTDDFGHERLIPQNVELDEAALRAIAATTGGEYFNAKSTTALAEVYARIDQLEKTEFESLLFSEYDDLFEAPLVAGLVLVALEALLVALRFRRFA